MGRNVAVTTLPRRLLRAAVSACVGACLLAGPAVPALAQQNNTAIEINTKDGSSVFKFSFSIAKVMNDVVDQTNGAAAVASCDDCRTVAVAIQIVLVGSDPSVVAPENVAIAYNQDCTACETMALAYQFVFGGGGEPLEFTHEGKEQLKEIRKAFHDLKKVQDTLTLEELAAQITALVAQVVEVINTELVVKSTGERVVPAPAPTVSPAASPSPGTEPSPTGSPSGEPSASPT
jgi:putative peptide zinc metalloprotease protein